MWTWREFREWIEPLGSTPFRNGMSIRSKTEYAGVFASLVVISASMLALVNIPQTQLSTTAYSDLGWRLTPVYFLGGFLLYTSLMDMSIDKPYMTSSKMLYIFDVLYFVILELGVFLWLYGIDIDNDGMKKSGIVLTLTAVFFSGLGYIKRARAQRFHNLVPVYNIEYNVIDRDVTGGDDNTRAFHGTKIVSKNVFWVTVIVLAAWAQMIVLGINTWKRGLDVERPILLIPTYAMLALAILFSLWDTNAKPIGSRNWYHLKEAFYWMIVLAGFLLWTIGFQIDNADVETSGLVTLCFTLILWASAYTVEVRNFEVFMSLQQDTRKKITPGSVLGGR
jgi:hypothetical protein